jgi:hypothetical protein
VKGTGGKGPGGGGGTGEEGLGGEGLTGALCTGFTLVNIKETFAPDLTYAMFSKVTNRKNLKTTKNLTPNDFIPCTFKDDQFNHNILQTPKFHFDTYIPKILKLCITSLHHKINKTNIF